MIGKTRPLSVLLCALSFPFTGFAGPVVEITVLDRDDNRLDSGSLTIVAEGVGITSHTFLSRGERWVVTDAAGARLRGELLAELPDDDLVILEIPGMRGAHLAVARELPELERTVSTLDASHTHTRGIRLAATADQPGRFLHTARYSVTAHGAPLLNNCGELIGISNAELVGILRRRLAEPAIPSVATGIDRITAALEEHGVAFDLASEACLSLEAQLEQAEREGAAAEEMERLLEEIQQRNAELEQARADIEENLAETQAEKAALEEMAETIQQRTEALELAKLEREEQLQRERALRAQQMKLALGGIASLLVLILLAVIALRKRKAMLASEQQRSGEMAEALSTAKATFPDIVLVGQDPEGQEVRVKINGNGLIRCEGGQILGRDPRTADHVLGLPEISRQHLRLLIHDGQLLAVDLDSHNGTSINETALTPGRETPLADGDVLTLGSIALQVHVLR